MSEIEQIFHFDIFGNDINTCSVNSTQKWKEKFFEGSYLKNFLKILFKQI